MRAALWCALFLAAAPAIAEDAGRSLTAERAALQQRFDTEERACAERFAVNACVDEVRARRRAALAPLREQQLRLDEIERQRRADERRAAVAQKQADLARRPLPPAAPELRLREPAQPGAPAASASAEAPRGGTASLARKAGEAGEAAEAAEAAQRARALQEARDRTAAAEARIRERRARQKEALAAKGRRPDTLPRPGGAASGPQR